MNLYEINEQIKNFNYEIDEETGEVLNLDELDNINLERYEKIENIACYIKNLKADEKALDDEIKALQSRKKAKKAKYTSLSEYLQNNLNGEKYESPRCRISYRKSTSVNVDDPEELFIHCQWKGLLDLCTESRVYKPNKAEIKKYLKDGGKELPSVELVEKTNMSIK